MSMAYPFEPPSVIFQSIGMPMDTKIDTVTLEQFAKVLMIIVGVKGRITVWERGWLAAFLSAHGAPTTVIRDLEDFDYRYNESAPILAQLLTGYYRKWVRRTLIPSAIRMSRADVLDEHEFAEIIYVAEQLGMSEDIVQEVHGLVNIFDSVNNTSTQLLSVAQIEDDRNARHATEELTLMHNWDDDDDKVPLAPEQVLLTQQQLVFAQAVIYVMAADGEVSDAEMSEFIAHMRVWGASDEQIRALTKFDYENMTAESIIEGSEQFGWGLSALTAVALRVAGADGLSPEEENALLGLYTKTKRSPTIYYATKGLEAVRRIALNRLNVIFAELL